MEFDKMTTEELETRKAEIATECEAEGADLNALTEEIRGINAELEKRKTAAAQKAEIRAAVASGKGTVVETMKEEKGKETMTLEEVRSSKAYIDAYANYIKTEKDEECRALLTEYGFEVVEGASGPLPVPTIVESRIRTAWERSNLLNLVRKTYVHGVLRVGFEVSATAARVHSEGEAAPAEEKLVLGIVDLIPSSIKKWIRISDEAMDMGGEEFLDYIYDEITAKIFQTAEAELLSAIVTSPRSSSVEAPGVPRTAISAANIITAVPTLLAALSDDATNPVIVMNRATFAMFRAAQASANYAFDPFDGLPVYFNSVLAAPDDASEDTKPWLIVGDFGVGAQANFPSGEEIRLKFDDLSEAESDLVKIIGRMYVGLGVVAPNAFAVATTTGGSN